MGNMWYGRQRLKDIAEKEAEEEATEQQQDDDEQYDMIPKIKLVYERKREKEFRENGNLNGANTKRIMANIIPHIEMRTKVIYLFKSEIHRGAGEIMDYSKTLTSPAGMLISLGEIQAYIEECEQKPLDLENAGRIYSPQEKLRYKVIMKSRWSLSMFK